MERAVGGLKQRGLEFLGSKTPDGRTEPSTLVAPGIRNHSCLRRRFHSHAAQEPGPCVVGYGVRSRTSCQGYFGSGLPKTDGVRLTNALVRGFDRLINLVFPKHRNRVLTVCPGGNDRQLWRRQFFPRDLYDFTNVRIDVIQEVSIPGFVTAPVPEVHLDLRGRQSAATTSDSPRLTRQRTIPNKTTRLFVLMSRLQGGRALFLVRPTKRRTAARRRPSLFQTCPLSERDAGIQLELPGPDRGCGDTGYARRRAIGECHTSVRNSEARVVEDVVTVDPELQPNALPVGEVFAQR